MTIKLTLPALAIVGIMACGQATAADSGTITFTGSILAAACTVNTGSVAQTIPMGTISGGSLGTTIGNIALPTNFTIVIDDCPDPTTNISIRFGGTANTADATILALTTGPAADFGVALFEADGATRINLNTDSAPQAVPDTGATLNFVAKLMKTSATPAAAGGYSAAATFSVIYN